MACFSIAIISKNKPQTSHNDAGNLYTRICMNPMMNTKFTKPRLNKIMDTGADTGATTYAQKLLCIVRSTHSFSLKHYAIVLL